MTPKEVSAIVQENNLLRSKMSTMLADGILMQEKVSGICKVYSVLRPVLKFLRVFAFIKSGGKAAIDAAIAVLDGVCDIK